LRSNTNMKCTLGGVNYISNHGQVLKQLTIIHKSLFFFNND